MSATEDVVIVLPVVPSLTYDRGVPASLPWVRPGGLQAEPWGHLWWLQEPVGFLEPLPEYVHWDPRLPASRAHEAAGEEGQADSKLESDSVGITGSLREQDLPSQVSEVTDRRFKNQGCQREMGLSQGRVQRLATGAAEGQRQSSSLVHVIKLVSSSQKLCV